MGRSPPSTEAQIQAVLMRRALRMQKRQAVCPNTTAYGWESDLLVTNRRGTVEEYEIKTTRRDWQAERRQVKQPDRPFNKAFRHLKLMTAGHDDQRWPMPNYFWLACPPDVVSLDELPGYAGLIIVHAVDMVSTETLRRAPRLHGTPMNDRVREHIERGMALRLSDMRWNLCHDQHPQG